MKTISIYENLPSGGARSLFRSNLSVIKKEFNVKVISDKRETIKIKNLFTYLGYIYLKYKYQNKILNKIIFNTDLFLAYHSWVTKSSILLRQTQIPEIYVCHEAPREFYDTEYISKFTFKDRIINTLRIGIKNIDKHNVSTNKKLIIIANSNFSASNIYRIYGNKSKIIYPGINLRKFNNNYPLDKRHNQILCVGSINKLKNQKYILEVISSMDKTKKPRVVFVGNGGDGNYIREMYKIAKKNDIDIVIKQNICDKELIAEYKMSKVFCYAPINEPFGIAVIEAMRSGLPIVASMYGGGYNEILSDSNGYILSPNNRHEWCVAIEKLLENKTVWNRFSKFNYNYASKFSDTIMNKKLVDIIKNSF